MLEGAAQLLTRSAPAWHDRGVAEPMQSAALVPMLRAALSMTGRLGRIGWWLSLGSAAVLLPLAELTRGGGLPLRLVGGALGLAALWLVVAANGRRLHDLGRSGYVQLIAVVPVIGSVVLLFWLGFLAGEPGPNRFGRSPASWWTA